MRLNRRQCVLCYFYVCLWPFTVLNDIIIITCYMFALCSHQPTTYISLQYKQSNKWREFSSQRASGQWYFSKWHRLLQRWRRSRGMYSINWTLEWVPQFVPLPTVTAIFQTIHNHVLTHRRFIRYIDHSTIKNTY